MKKLTILLGMAFTCLLFSCTTDLDEEVLTKDPATNEVDPPPLPVAPPVAPTGNDDRDKDKDLR